MCFHRNISTKCCLIGEKSSIPPCFPQIPEVRLTIDPQISRKFYQIRFFHFTTLEDQLPKITPQCNMGLTLVWKGLNLLETDLFSLLRVGLSGTIVHLVFAIILPVKIVEGLDIFLYGIAYRGCFPDCNLQPPPLMDDELQRIVDCKSLNVSIPDDEIEL